MSRSTTWKSVGATLLAAALVLTAGCAAIPGGADQTSTGTPAQTTEAQPTTETTAPTTQTTQTTTSSDEGHSHDENATEHSHDDAGDAGDAADAAMTGQMSVVVADDELSVAGDGSRGDGVWFEPDGEGYHVWHASNGTDVTLADALETTGVEATDARLAYEGETYRESADGTTLAYRVNGESVDPTEYTLEDGDEVWVTVETAEMDREVPGDHIDHEHSHIHGDIEFVVDGEEVDFSEDRYQTASHSQFFHFEGGHADPWHAHSWAVTLQYGMETLDGIAVTEDSVTYNGTTYEDGDAGTDVTVQVNGESVDPSEYYLKDGDHVTIEVETDDGGGSA